jgi:hypothetical protein
VFEIENTNPCNGHVNVAVRLIEYNGQPLIVMHDLKLNINFLCMDARQGRIIAAALLNAADIADTPPEGRGNAYREIFPEGG